MAENNNSLLAGIISIHAPPRGATQFGEGTVCLSSNFNSRPSARGDDASPPQASAVVFQFTPLREGRPVRA